MEQQQQELNIGIIHPDLGIGGAEQLIVNLALSLQKQKHKVTIYTPIFDTNHCFSACKNGQLNIQRIRTFIPKINFFIALLAYLRMIIVTFYIILFCKHQDVYIVDQVSISVPILYLFRKKVIFYCHFPDKLLCVQRKSIIKKIYRFFIDQLEEFSLRYANKILMNSKFTQDVFNKNFKSLTQIKQDILYPAIELEKFDITNKKVQNKETYKYFISLNRYERKKNIKLAIESFNEFLKQIEEKDDVRLIIAGGYDDEIAENVQHFKELENMAKEYGIIDKVIFYKNVCDETRSELLKNAICVLYTPHNEHFGIVPIETMYCKSIVICDESGGPKESIIDSQTGYLIPGANPIAWSNKMLFVYNLSPQLKAKIANNARQRVISLFSLQSFSTKANQHCLQLIDTTVNKKLH